MHGRILSWSFVPALSLLAASCTGNILGGADRQPGGAGDGGSGAGSTGGTAPNSGGNNPAPLDPGERVTDVGQITDLCQAKTAPTGAFTPLRRLNRQEVANTIRDLVGVPGVIDGLLADSKVGTFDSNTDVAISELQTDKYRKAVESVATKVAANPATIVKCSATTGETCATTFIRDFGLKAFRRPLTAGEQANYLAVYRVGAVRGGFNGGVGLVVRALLQSPYFLYLVETTSVGSAAPVTLSPYEVASRLSFLMWGSLPDDELFAAAARAELATGEQLRAQVTRMLADPRASQTLAEFQLQWLGLDDTDSVTKDATLFPKFNDALKKAMRDEVVNFLGAVMKGDASLTTLLTAPYAVLEGPLYDVYGAKAPAVATGPARVDFPAGQRSGILTQPVFLATHAHPDQGSPVKRGVWVRQAILCQDLPPPPPDVNNTAPKISPNSTTRQRFAQHVAVVACRACHALIDGIGFGFERYDALGTYRDTENGLPIDDSGILNAASPDVEGPFRGPVELGGKLALSDVSRSCFVTQWFRFAFKREPQAPDACTAAAMTDTFAASQQNIRELILSTVATTAFRYGVGEP